MNKNQYLGHFVELHCHGDDVKTDDGRDGEVEIFRSHKVMHEQTPTGVCGIVGRLPHLCGEVAGISIVIINVIVNLIVKARNMVEAVTHILHRRILLVKKVIDKASFK